MNQLEDTLRTFVKENLERVMKEELTQVLDVEHPEANSTKNGTYGRQLDTRYGRVSLRVPRDRKGIFQTQVFQPYRRREGWLEEAVIAMYTSGMGTREIATFIERVLGAKYSAATISNITEVVTEDIQKWKERPITKHYSVLYLDGLYVSLRRGTVEKESIYLVMGVTLEGYREILGFYIGGRESATGWQEILEDLYRRGLKEVLLGVFDGLAGLEEAFRRVYPKADVQRCVVHKVRNTLSKVRKKDQTEVAEDLKKVYYSPTKKVALEQFEEIKEKWNKKYSREMASWQKDLSVLLTFLDYPSSIQRVLYTTNWIERTVKEFRKLLKPMNSLPSIESAEKVVYLKIQDFNKNWGDRKLRGFAQAESFRRDLFEKRYPES